VKNIINKVRDVFTTVASWLRNHPAIILSVVSAIVLLYATLWVFTVRIRHQAVDFINTSLGCDISAESVSVTPSLRIKLNDVKVVVAGSPSKEPDITCEKVVLAADAPSLFMGRVRLREVDLVKPTIRLSRDADGRWGLSEWAKRMETCNTEGIESSFPPRVEIHDGKILIVEGGSEKGVLLAKVTGLAGLASASEVGIDMNVEAFGSKARLHGSIFPCIKEGLNIDGNVAMFDIEQAREAVVRIFPFVGDAVQGLPSGRGPLSFSVEGGIDDPYIVGSLSTRDFDTSFAFLGDALEITNFRLGASSQRISGSGRIDFSTSTTPFKFSMVLEGLNLRRVIDSFPEMESLEHRPSGVLSGFISLTGNIGSPQFELETARGKLTVRQGELNLPHLEPNSRTGMQASSDNRLPFDEINASVSLSEEGSVVFNNITVSAEDWGATATARIDCSFYAESCVDEEIPYFLMVNMSSANMLSLVSHFPALRGNIGGRMRADASFTGIIGRTEGLSGSGSVTLKNGFIVNPYLEARRFIHQTLDFDYARVDFSFNSEALMLEESNISGEGVDIFATGTIGVGGNLNIRAEARLSPERARDFEGLSPYVASSDLASLVTYYAKCHVTGTFDEPSGRWTKPSVTRW